MAMEVILLALLFFIDVSCDRDTIFSPILAAASDIVSREYSGMLGVGESRAAFVDPGGEIGVLI